MRCFFLFVCLLATVFSKEDLYKKYKYLSLGVNGVKDFQAPAAQQIGLGYRVSHKRVFFIDSTDIFVSLVSNKASINTYSGYVFPRVLFISNLTYEKPLYVGIGGAYLKEKFGKTTEIIMANAPIKIRKNKSLRRAAASIAIGKTFYVDSNLISFSELNINIPSVVFFDEKYTNLITASFSINIGF
jgi:hypothetical protein